MSHVKNAKLNKPKKGVAYTVTEDKSLKAEVAKAKKAKKRPTRP